MYILLKVQNLIGAQGPFENPFITVAFLCFASDHILMVNILNLNQKPQIIIIPIIIVIVYLIKDHYYYICMYNN